MLPLVVVGCMIVPAHASVREVNHASGVDNAASPDWQETPLNGMIFTLRERLITMQKQLEGTQAIHEQCIELFISMGNSQLWAHINILVSINA